MLEKSSLRHSNDNYLSFPDGWLQRELSFGLLPGVSQLIRDQVKIGCDSCNMVLSDGECALYKGINTDIPRLCSDMIPKGTFQKSNF